MLVLTTSTISKENSGQVSCATRFKGFFDLANGDVKTEGSNSPCFSSDVLDTVRML